MPRQFEHIPNRNERLTLTLLLGLSINVSRMLGNVTDAIEVFGWRALVDLSPTAWLQTTLRQQETSEFMTQVA